MKRQRGYSLVELMIALAITGCISTVVGVVVQQTVTVPARGDDQVSATHAIQNAVHWVSIDGQEAKSATGGTSLVLTLPDNSKVTYSLSGDDIHRVDTGADRIIARGISSVDFSVDGQLITMAITAAQENRFNINESGTYQISMRPSA